MLTDREADAVDFIAYLDNLGITIRANEAGMLLVNPPSQLRPGDADFIRGHKPELLDLLAHKRCCKVCPGVEHEQCAGCPSPNIEIMFAGGLIAPQWCSGGIDECATHWRERGGEWHKVGESDVVVKAGRTPTSLAVMMSNINNEQNEN